MRRYANPWGEGYPCQFFERKRSARTRPQRRPRCQWPRTHAEARAEGRWDVTQGIAAAGAAALDTKGPGGVCAQPLASRLALRINALHREAGQKLHIVSLGDRRAFAAPVEVARTRFPQGDGGPLLRTNYWRGFWRSPSLLSRGKTTICGGAVAAGIFALFDIGVFGKKTIGPTRRQPGFSPAYRGFTRKSKSSRNRNERLRG